MKTIITYTIFTICLLFANQMSNAQETRTGLALKYKPVKKIKTETSAQYRNKELDNITTRSLVGKFEASTKRLKYIEAGFSIRYNYQWTKDLESEYEKEDKVRLGVFAEIPLKLDKVKFTDKVRYQYYINSRHNTKYYFRHKFKAEFKPVSSIETSISHELFYNLEKHKIDKTRIKFDVKFRLTDNYDLAGFYVVDLEPIKSLSSYHITGIEITVKL